MWKFIAIAVIGYFAYRMFMNDKKRKSDDEQKTKDNLIATGELVKDPVCGAYIDADATITVRDGQTVHRFCSYECRDQFVAQQKAIDSTDSTDTSSNK